MPNTTLSIAVVSYWNAKGLNTSIAKLHPGQTSATPETTVPTPTTAGMPRAQYILQRENPDVWSKGGLVVTQDLYLEVYSTDSPTAERFMQLISAAFNNAENAVTNPMTLDPSTGQILGVMEQGDLYVDKEDDAVFHGFAMYEIRWRKPNNRPS